MTMLPADWILSAVALAMAVLGLFRGFSGSIAFIVALISAGAVGSFGWGYSEQYIEIAWQRGAVLLVVALLTFGIIRAIVKKVVNGLLAQPTDAIFGFIVGAASAALAVIIWAKSGYYLEYSNIATEVARYVR